VPLSSVSQIRVSDQPDSPNTVLRRTLNIAPPAPADTGQQLSPVASHLSTFQPVKATMPDITATTRKLLDNSVAVLSDAIKMDSSNCVCADVAAPAGLMTPQALLQSHFTAKVNLSQQQRCSMCLHDNLNKCEESTICFSHLLT